MSYDLLDYQFAIRKTIFLDFLVLFSQKNESKFLRMFVISLIAKNAQDLLQDLL